jgi:putative acetyltransferase
MNFSADYAEHMQEIAELVSTTFTDSEDPTEGALIGDLALKLMSDTPQQDLFVFLAREGGALVAVIFFSRLVYDGDARNVFVMGPVAVATLRQRQGIGQELITYGLDALRRQGVDVAITYGDPNFYWRVGFEPVSERDIPAPFALQHPEGWLGQPLTQVELKPFTGPVRCVSAFRNPAFW